MPPLYVITWMDHSFESSGRAKPHRYRSVGYLIDESDEFYLISMSLNADGTIPTDENLETVAILKCAVLASEMLP